MSAAATHLRVDMDLERYRELAYGTALSLLGDHHLAEDAVQEAFFEAHR